MLFRKINIILLVLLAAVTTATFASSTDDLTITNEVKAILIKEQDIPKDIEVTTKDGIVSLKGRVDTHLQAHKAIELASSVDKVVDVIDTDLKVKESKSIVNDAILTAKVKGKIRHLYIYHKLEPNYDLHVETTNQVVHIFGSVNRALDVDTIVNATKEVKGVKSVRTSIKHP
jgi:hyperosmotically inducible protein